MSSSTSASEPPTARRAWIALAVCICGVAAVVTTVQWAWQHYELLARISPARYQLALAERSAAQARSLGVGDSHTGLGFYPPTADAHNIAFAGESVRDMRAKVDRLLPSMPRLETAYVQAQPHLLFPHRNRPVSPLYAPSSRGESFHPFERWLEQFDPCCRGQALPLALRAIAGRPGPFPGPDVLTNGYLDYSRYTSYERSRFAELAAREIEAYGELRFLPELVTEYERLVDSLRARRINVVLLRFPLSRSYWAAIGRQTMARADEVYLGIARSRGVALCGDWGPWEDKFFFNPDHLARETAQSYWQVIERCS